MESEELIVSELLLTVILPEGQQSVVTVPGSQPVIDLLVTLCAQYHLNPSDYVIELMSSNQKLIKFKPNTPIGSLEAERVVLKPKQNDEINRKVSNVPVATVRLIINYRKSHKAVVRVNPRDSLVALMPAICDKCELDPKTTVLLRDIQSDEPLDLTKTLNDYGIRDLYAKELNDSGEFVPHERINRGVLCLFRRGKNTNEETPDISKKRQAPQPPSMSGSQSISSTLVSSQEPPLPKNDSFGKQGVLTCVPTDLKRTKRRAPPPPGISPSKPERERFCVKTPVIHDNRVDAQEDHFSGAASNHNDDFPTSSLMKEILSEFMDRLKSQDQVEHFSDRSKSSHVSSHTPNLYCSVNKFVNSKDCESFGQNQGKPWDHRNGVNTFTVVPRKNPHISRQYEIAIKLETLEPGESGKNMEERSDDLRNSKPISTSNEVPHDKMEHVNNVNKTCGNSDVSEAPENALDIINLNNHKEKHLLGEKNEINYQDLSEQAHVEVKENRLQNRYHEKVFLNGYTMSSDRAMVEDEVEETKDDFTARHPHIPWRNEDLKSKNPAMIGNDKKGEDKETTANYQPGPRHEPHCDPYWKAYLDRLQVPFKYQSPNSISKFGLNPSFSKEKVSSQNLTQSDNTSLVLSKRLGPASNPEPHQNVRPHFARLVSPFALAVSQRAMSVKKMGYPLIPSGGRFNSSTLLHLNTAEGMCK